MTPERPVIVAGRDLDHTRLDAQNTKDVAYTRAAKRLKDWRREHQIDQVEFARRARISVGCVQGFERGIRATRQANLAKIARTMGLSVDQLLADDAPVVTPDPLLKDLRHEDKLVAHYFHHSSGEVKVAIRALLHPDFPDDELRDAVAIVLRQLLGVMNAETVEYVRRILSTPKPKTDVKTGP